MQEIIERAKAQEADLIKTTNNPFDAPTADAEPVDFKIEASKLNPDLEKKESDLDLEKVLDPTTAEYGLR